MECGERVFRSPYGDLRLPRVDTTAFVLNKISEYGDRLALLEEPPPGANGDSAARRVTYAEFPDLVQHLARGLHRLGVRAGDVIAMVTPNCLEYFLVFYAAALTRARLTTANPLLTGRELRDQLADSGARWVLATPHTLPTVTTATTPDRSQVANTHSGVREVIIIGGDDSDQQSGTRSFESVLRLGEAGDPVDLDQQEDPDDDPLERVFLLPYSSGTTGKSKGVQIPHRTLVAQCVQLSYGAVRHVHAGDVCVHVLPMYHAYALITTLVLALWSGATNIIVTGRFNLHHYLGLLSRHSATLSYIVPPIAVQLAKAAPGSLPPLPALRTLITAAAPISADIMQQVKDRLKIADFRNCFGMSEVGIILFPPVEGSVLASAGHLVQGMEGDNKITSPTAGKPLLGSQVIVRDIETGRSLGPGSEGELLFRGPTVLAGYLNRPDIQFMTHDGWFITGDIGYVDEGGNYYITDRLKELIKYKGHQVAPAELEAVLLTHPAVADAAVVGLPDLAAGELPTAFVVREPGVAEVTAQQLCKFVAEQVSPQSRLHGGVRFVDAVPKSPSGKILRRLLRDQAAREGQAGEGLKEQAVKEQTSTALHNGDQGNSGEPTSTPPKGPKDSSDTSKL